MKYAIIPANKTIMLSTIYPFIYVIYKSISLELLLYLTLEIRAKITKPYQVTLTLTCTVITPRGRL